MFIYSKTTSAFISRVRIIAREIINFEMHLKMDKTRILYKNTFYPLNIIVFEDQSRLGYFDYRTYEIGISKTLMYQAKDEVLKNIIRHELAHFYAYLLSGPNLGHGSAYHDLCKNFGWDARVYNAYANIEIENGLSEKLSDEDKEGSKILERVKKLMALSSSDNIHESEMATLKANELLLEHNLTFAKSKAYENGNEDNSTIYVKRVLEAKRRSAKHVAICEILKTFYVSPVFNHGQGVFYLEVVGDKTPVLLADYVASFLDKELDFLWTNAKKANPSMKGQAFKNSFFRGIAKGHAQKIELQKSTLAKGSDLVALSKDLRAQVSIVYPHLSQTSSRSQHREEAYREGQTQGERLTINPGLKNNESQTFFLN